MRELAWIPLSDNIRRAPELARFKRQVKQLKFYNHNIIYLRGNNAICIMLCNFKSELKIQALLHANLKFEFK